MPNDEPPEETVINVTPIRRTKKGWKPSPLTLARKLREEPMLAAGKMFTLDEFTGDDRVAAYIPRPDVEPPKRPFKPRSLRETDITHLIELFEAMGAIGKISPSLVWRAVQAEAERNSFSSARQAFDRLPQWDGVYRLEKFFQDCCGAELDGSDDEIWAKQRYLSAVGKCFFISIVARVIEPGCQVDTMLILEGPQGTQKTSLLRALALRDEWFSDNMPADVKSKDAKAHLRGRLIVEMSELAQLRVSGVETLKNFLSIREDVYRPPYGRGEIVWKRQCVLVGTTNSDDYLVDVTGNRRFWPVKTGAIDLAKVRDIRDQLYAEALTCYRAKEQWYLPADIELIAGDEQRARLTSDPWEGRVAELVAEKKLDASGRRQLWATVTASEVLARCAGDIQHWDTPKLMRAARILTKLGGMRIWVTKADKSRGKEYRFDVTKGGASGAGDEGIPY